MEWLIVSQTGSNKSWVDSGWFLAKTGKHLGWVGILVSYFMWEVQMVKQSKGSSNTEPHPSSIPKGA